MRTVKELQQALGDSFIVGTKDEPDFYIVPDDSFPIPVKALNKTGNWLAVPSGIRIIRAEDVQTGGSWHEENQAH